MQNPLSLWRLGWRHLRFCHTETQDTRRKNAIAEWYTKNYGRRTTARSCPTQNVSAPLAWTILTEW